MSEKELAFPDPEPDDVSRLAHRLLAKTNLVDARVLDQLVGHPRRYAELRDSLVQGKSDTPLTRALRRLRRDGLIRRRSDVGRDPPVDRYELTDLGTEVLFTVHNYRFLTRLQAKAHREIADAAGV